MKRYLFIDGSVNTKTKVGMGAWLLVTKDQLDTDELDQLNNQIRFARFEQTSSTKLELENCMFALKSLEEIFCRQQAELSLVIYTDSQCIAGLPRRRQKLEATAFESQASGKQLANAALYQEFYLQLDKLNIEVIKVKGHKRESEKDRVDRIFSLVDKAARRGLKQKMYS